MKNQYLYMEIKENSRFVSALWMILKFLKWAKTNHLFV